MGKPIIIFDFDGTIANTLDPIIAIVNRISDEFGHRQVLEEDIPILREKKPKEILSHLGIPIYKLPFWTRRITSEINQEIGDLQPSTNLKPTLLLLKERGCKIGILTTNTEENVKKFLESNELNIFDFLYSGNSVFGKSKVLRKLITKNNLKKENVLYVGDEVRDMNAGKKSKVITVAVSWGFNSKEALKKEKPDYLIDSPSELEPIVFSLTHE